MDTVKSWRSKSTRLRLWYLQLTLWKVKIFNKVSVRKRVGGWRSWWFSRKHLLFPDKTTPEQKKVTYNTQSSSFRMEEITRGSTRSVASNGTYEDKTSMHVRTSVRWEYEDTRYCTLTPASATKILRLHMNGVWLGYYWRYELLPQASMFTFLLHVRT